MSDNFRPIEQLIDIQQTESGIMLKVPIAVRSAIQADLETVVKAQRAGKNTPSLVALSSFFEEEYDCRIPKSSIRDWLIRIAKELPDD